MQENRETHVVRPAVPAHRTDWADFHGPNAGYVLELFEQFQADPSSLHPEIRAFFERWRPPEVLPTPSIAVPEVARPDTPSVTLDEYAAKVAALSDLATAIREYGHRAARLDPLGSEPPGDPELHPPTHGLRDEDLDRLPAVAISGPAAQGAATARQAIDELRRIYCGTTAYDYDQVQDAQERTWLRDAAETERFRPPNDPIDARALLERLSEVGAFERFLQRTFPGQTRFSIEGCGMLIPILDEIIGGAAEAGARGVLIGMAHRGRLNVLAHVLGKSHVDILEEFKNPSPRAGISLSGVSGEEFSGDVKYHLGARRAIRNGTQVEMAVTLAPNPSHLEYVNPVVEGMCRAVDSRRDQPGYPILDEVSCLPLLIHGDASFPAQGVVAETLNLSRLPGYRTGGTIHIIVNNQLGFTVDPLDGRSTLYASDLAKGFEIPIVHVNADDPEACIAAARLAHSYRETFHKDVLIDLIGYRRWGHNEGDDPTLTQPVMYAKIASHPTVRELWGDVLVRRGLATEQEVADLLTAKTAELQQALAEVNERLERRGEAEPQDHADALRSPKIVPSTDTLAAQREASGPFVVKTGVPLENLRALNEALYRVPEGFTLHPRLERFVWQPRQKAFDAGPDAAIDWGHAEALAFASILADGTPIRLTGQDVGRGTFAQRHDIVYDAKTGQPYIPHHRLPPARASFEIWDSPLSESAVVGFEFGYSVQAPETLVLWEAQYGDFVNSAQVMVDQFIVSARTKWGQQPSLVLLLPHGYEGQGPEHSSARPERFLEACAEENIRVANCTTSAQYFHLLRRQAKLLRGSPRPLIVLTPKSLLRLKIASSSPEEFAEGSSFHPVLDDPFFRNAAEERRARVERVILCSGKVYADLASSEARPKAHRVAIVRIEQLYRFPAAEIERVLAGYPAARDVVWLQEEPQNMGAWSYMALRLQAILARRTLSMRYIGRPERASPSEGTPTWHTTEQARIVAAAFEGLVTRQEETEAIAERPETAATVKDASRLSG
jgi:2-oxoglutarate dehydrogenase E1 component